MHMTVADGGGVEQRAGRAGAGQRRPGAAAAGSRRRRPRRRARTACPARGSRAVGAVLEHARDQQHAEQRDRQRRQHLAAGLLGQDRPRHQRHEHDLDVGQHGGQPGADVADRVVPQDQVDGEEDARPSSAARRSRQEPRAEAPVLEPGEQRQHRQRVDAAEDRRGRRRGVAEADQDARERDRQRADHGAQADVALGGQPALHVLQGTSTGRRALSRDSEVGGRADGVKAAVDVHDLAADRAGVIRQQEADRARHRRGVARCPSPAEPVTRHSSASSLEARDPAGGHGAQRAGARPG